VQICSVSYSCSCLYSSSRHCASPARTCKACCLLSCVWPATHGQQARAVFDRTLKGLACDHQAASLLVGIAAACVCLGGEHMGKDVHQRSASCYHVLDRRLMYIFMHLTDLFGDHGTLNEYWAFKRLNTSASWRMDVSRQSQSASITWDVLLFTKTESAAYANAGGPVRAQGCCPQRAQAGNNPQPCWPNYLLLIQTADGVYSTQDINLADAW
jgi:hypothetical protein